ncbi:MAG TPA: class I SAM-dependent methyltransferase [Thermoanaerobaculia bacterium]
MSDPRAFYDGLAGLYHLIYEDWTGSIERQASAIDAVIREAAPRARDVADVACGIGTQALGLAARGYRVTASDIAGEAVRRATTEAAARGVQIDFRTDDMTRLSTYGAETADALVALDNAVPHLLSDAEIVNAFRQFFRVLRPGGVCVISVRDYAAISREQFRLVPYGVRVLPDAKVAVFQIWTWHGERYDLDIYFVRDSGDAVHTQVFRSRYYAVPIARLIELFGEAGFVDVRQISDAFFQPILTARRPAS